MQKPLLIGNTCLDAAAQRILVGGTPVPLSPQEYLIIEYALTRRTRIWRQDDLKTHLFEFVYYGALPIPRSRSWLYVQMFNIRKKIKKAGSTMVIKGNPNSGGYSIYADEGVPH